MYKLPDTLKTKKITTQTIISWVIDVAKDVSDVVSYFYHCENSDDTRFFWSTPDRSLTMVGLGDSREFIGKNYQKMSKVQQELKQQVITNSVCAETGLLILGGFPFDDSVDSQHIWGDMGQGYLFVPKLMMTNSIKGNFLTINMTVSSNDDLAKQWDERMAEWQQLIRNTSEVPEIQSPVKLTENKMDEWLQTVDKAVEEIKSDSEIKKIVLARELVAISRNTLSINAVLENMLSQQENTYFFALSTSDGTFIGATPERLLLSQDNSFSTACVAGSLPRGKTKDEDELLGQQLLDDMKNQHEHQVVVDSIEKDMQEITTKLSEKGQPTLLKNRDIQHLFFPFSGEKKKGLSVFDAVNQLHPTPALGGEPKELTKCWIKDYEPMTRGMYGAPIGWCSVTSDEGEFAVGIRSAFISGNNATLYAGCGIVADSVAEHELAETRVKFNPMLRAIGGETFVTSK